MAEYVNLAKGPRGWPRARTQLDGVFYVLTATWNTVESSWSLTVADERGETLPGCAGLVLRHGVDVLAPFTSAVYPGGGRGKLGAWDTSNRGLDPGRDALARGSEVRLAYIPAEG